MRHTDGYLEFRHSLARGSSRLYSQTWLPDGETRAAVLLVHGLGEHSARYEHVATHLTSRGFAVRSREVVLYGDYRPEDWDLHPDGDRFVVTRAAPVVQADEDEDERGEERFVVILNFFEVLREKVGG